MIQQFSRFRSLWHSRGQGLDELAGLETLDQTLAWAAHGRLLGFNASALRFRVIYSLARLIRATEFIETGTYHAATAICASNSLRIPVRSCEASLNNCLAAKFVTYGRADIQITHALSERWLPAEVERQRRRKGSRPFFYLDAHPGDDAENWPVRAELGLILKLDSFLVVIDDFSLPEKPTATGCQWAGQLNPTMIQSDLMAGGIREIYYPSYSPEFETGHGRTGFAVLYRSPELPGNLPLEQFPFNLLKVFPLGGRA